MTTLYVASRVENPVIPIMVGTWPTAMLRAEPVMYAQIAASEMNSTSQPSRARPRKHTIEPAIIAREEAMISAGTWPWSFFEAVVTTVPVTVDRTATG
jgi:hypothetical protein